ncbi:hypothetical protein CHS0354_013909 [Potamilus streckersoni]|uniref:Ig-like domain-containing protein n=1 Tax=Potamilus streckersoni TaxID=2493646 RepID=A0AAE0RWV7_9BIVA|nr:hypothetical protein CHS0354_013909 [Potamilus streckersoni]
MLKMGFLVIFLLLSLTSPGWCVDPRIYIVATYPYTERLYNTNAMVVNKDGDAFLSCAVDNRPVGMPLQWIWMWKEYTRSISTDTEATDPYKYQIDKPADNNWRLKIQNIQPSDEGLYICRVQLGDQQYANDSRTLFIVESPQIIDIYTSSDTTVKEGDPVELRCNASGRPSPIITWTRLGDGILPNGGREQRGYYLRITAAQAEHRGHYKCIAKNSAGQDVRVIRLDVKFHPRVTVVENRVYQATGYLKELVCQVRGNPVPTENQIMWSKDDSTLQGNSFLVFENTFGSNTVMMKLTIPRVQDQDFGRYTCLAENSEGADTTYIDLMRSDTPTSDRKGVIRSGAVILTFSITTLLMMLSVLLLHLC